jgi:hypothetical protein
VADYPKWDQMHNLRKASMILFVILFVVFLVNIILEKCDIIPHIFLIVSPMLLLIISILLLGLEGLITGKVIDYRGMEINRKCDPSGYYLSVIILLGISLFLIFTFILIGLHFLGVIELPKS